MTYIFRTLLFPTLLDPIRTQDLMSIFARYYIAISPCHTHRSHIAVLPNSFLPPLSDIQTNYMRRPRVSYRRHVGHRNHWPWRLIYIITLLLFLLIVWNSNIWIATSKKKKITTATTTTTFVHTNLFLCELPTDCWDCSVVVTR